MNERHIFGKVSGEIFLKTVRVEVVNPEKFDAPKEHLKTGSLLLYFPHFAKLDAIVYGNVIIDNLTTLDNVTSMVAMKYLDPKRNRIQNELMRSWEEAYGLNILPIVQEEDKESYTNSSRININSLNQAVSLLNQPGKIVGVSPEGTRSKSGQLLQAKEGFELLLKRGKNVLALPLAGIQGRVLPILTKTTVIVGEAFSYEEIKAEQQVNPGKTITELAMLRLASLLPPENRGYYR